MIFIPIIILSTVIKGQLVTVNSATLCHCDRISDQDSCLQMGQSCTWTNNQCSTSPCSLIEQSKCIKTPNCSWTNSQCIDFNGCQNLKGYTILACQSQNLQCYWVGSTNCSSISQINCSEIYQQQDCIYSGSTLCYWNDYQCKQLTSCSLLFSDQVCTTKKTLGACIWNSTSQQCIINTCSMQTDCQPILFTTTNLNLYQVCVSSNTTYCQNGNPMDLTQENCLSQSVYTYSWVNYNSTVGVCQPCVNNQFNQLLNYLMGMMILQFLN